MDPAAPVLALSKAVLSSRTKPFLLRRGRSSFPFAARASAPDSASAPRGGLAVPGDLLLISLARLALRGPGLPAAAVPRRWFASVSAAKPLASGGPPRGGDGGPGNGDGDGGGGGGGGDGWKRPRASQGAGVVEEAPAQGADVIVLDVGGMSCGGCASSVKRILESEPQVRSATVNLATEMAVVWAVPEDRDVQDWKEQLGEKLANQLTTYGYKSNLRVNAAITGQVLSKG